MPFQYYHRGSTRTLVSIEDGVHHIGGAHVHVKTSTKKSGMFKCWLKTFNHTTVLDGKMLTGCPLREFPPPIDYMQ